MCVIVNSESFEWETSVKNKGISGQNRRGIAVFLAMFSSLNEFVT